jgi:hypothetical protein
MGPQGPPGLGFNPGKLDAFTAAISQPAWLEKGENYSVSGGLGFGENATAFGLTGIMRIAPNAAAYGGFAVGPSRLIGGKVGARFGW